MYRLDAYGTDENLQHEYGQIHGLVTPEVRFENQKVGDAFGEKLFTVLWNS